MENTVKYFHPIGYGRVAKKIININEKYILKLLVDPENISEVKNMLDDNSFIYEVKENYEVYIESCTRKSELIRQLLKNINTYND